VLISRPYARWLLTFLLRLLLTHPLRPHSLLNLPQRLAAFSSTANGNGPLRHFQLQGLLLLGSLLLCNVQAPLATLWSQRKVLWSRRSATRRVLLQQKKSP
jgi:hypothetical protein